MRLNSDKHALDMQRKQMASVYGVNGANKATKGLGMDLNWFKFFNSFKYNGNIGGTIGPIFGEHLTDMVFGETLFTRWNELWWGIK